jgi:hypothetical protein
MDEWIFEIFRVFMHVDRAMDGCVDILRANENDEMKRKNRDSGIEIEPSWFGICKRMPIFNGCCFEMGNKTIEIMNDGWRMMDDE